jgi:hypothetical protein
MSPERERPDGGTAVQWVRGGGNEAVWTDVACVGRCRRCLLSVVVVLVSLFGLCPCRPRVSLARDPRPSRLAVARQGKKPPGGMKRGSQWELFGCGVDRACSGSPHAAPAHTARVARGPIRRRPVPSSAMGSCISCCGKVVEGQPATGSVATGDSSRSVESSNAATRRSDRQDEQGCVATPHSIRVVSVCSRAAASLLLSCRLHPTQILAHTGLLSSIGAPSRSLGSRPIMHRIVPRASSHPCRCVAPRPLAFCIPPPPPPPFSTVTCLPPTLRTRMNSHRGRLQRYRSGFPVAQPSEW